MKRKNTPIQVVVASPRICLSPRPEPQTEDEEPKPVNIALKWIPTQKKRLASLAKMRNQAQERK
jgi:hypothetical protein